MNRLKKFLVLSIITCLLAVAGSFGLAEETEQASLPEQDSGTEQFVETASAQAPEEETPIKLFVYLEIGENKPDETWLAKAADLTAAAAFLYEDSSRKVEIPVYLTPSRRDGSAEESQLRLVETFSTDQNSLRRMREILTGSRLDALLKNQKDNQALNRYGMELVAKVCNEDPAEEKRLLVFSHVKEMAWMEDPNLNIAQPAAVWGNGLDGKSSVALTSGGFFSMDAGLSPAEMAFKTYEAFEGKTLEWEEHTGPWTISISDMILGWRAITDGTVKGSGSRYETDGMAMFESSYQKEMKLEGEETGKSWAIIFRTDFKLSTLEDIAHQESHPEGYEKSEEILARAELLTSEGKSLSSPKDWKVSAELQDSRGNAVQNIELEFQWDSYKGHFEPVSAIGDYYIHVSASNEEYGKEITADNVPRVHVLNRVPVLASEEPVIPSLVAWDWLEEVYSKPCMSVLSFFMDDGDKPEALSYRLEEEDSIKGVWIEDKKLVVDATQMTEKEVTVHLEAMDTENGISEAKQPIRIIRYSLDDLYQLDTEGNSFRADGYAKGTPMDIQAILKVSEEIALPEAVNQGEWTLTAYILQEDGTVAKEQEMKEQEGVYRTDESFSESRKGNYTLKLSAVNSNGWVLDAVKLGEVKINNEDPVWNGEPLPKITLLKNMPVEVDQSALCTVSLKDRFSDDGSDSLDYSLVQTVNGVKREETTITLIPNDMATGTQTLTVTASDKEGGSGSTSFNVKVIDIGELLKSKDAFSLSTEIDQSETYYKNSELSVTTVLTQQNEDVKYYLSMLNDEQCGEFLKGISFRTTGGVVAEPETTLKESAEEAKIEPETMLKDVKEAVTELKEKGTVMASYSMPNPRATGSYQMMTQAFVFDSENAAASDSINLKIENRELKQATHLAIDEKLLIPGPLFLNAGKTPDQYPVELEELLETEPLDVLQIQLSGLNGGKMVKEGDYWLYTDSKEVTEQENQLVFWDVGTQEEPAKAPEIFIMPTKHGSYQIKMIATDDGDSEVTVPMHFTVEYPDEKNILIIAAAVAGLIVLLIAALIIHQKMKPAYLPGSRMQVSLSGIETDVQTGEWKKDSPTLRDLLIFSGAPINGDISMKACDNVTFEPGKAGRGCIIHNGAPAEALEIWMGGAHQTDRNIHVSDGVPVEIHFSDGTVIALNKPAD